MKEVLGTAYDNIATKGNISIQPGASVQQQTMADRYNKRRVFEWTSDQAYFDFTDTSATAPTISARPSSAISTRCRSISAPPASWAVTPTGWPRP